jgi:hypothetical protein
VIVQATTAHAKALEIRLPGGDEYFKAMGKTLKDGLLDDLSMAHEAWTWLYDGEPGAVFGVNYLSMTMPPIFWLYPGPQVVEHPVAFLRQSLKLKPYFMGKYPVLSGACNISFEQSERFIRWLGGVFGEPREVVGMTMRPFHIGEA